MLRPSAHSNIGLTERRTSWREAQERERQRRALLHSGTPITLHAAMYKPSIPWSNRTPSSHSLRSSGSSSSSSTASQILMPAPRIQDVHCHYAKITVRMACPIISVSEVVQHYDHHPLENLKGIGFQHVEHPYAGRAPRRKKCSLENLPPLNSKTRAEIGKWQQKVEQVAIWENVTKKHRQQDEERRRALRRQQHPVPPYNPVFRRVIRKKSLPSIAVSMTEAEAPTSPELQRNQQVARYNQQSANAKPASKGNSAAARHVRWAADVKDTQTKQQCSESQHSQTSEKQQSPKSPHRHVADPLPKPSPPIPIPRAKRSLNLTELTRGI